MFKFYSKYFNCLLEAGRLSGGSNIACLHFAGSHTLSLDLFCLQFLSSFCSLTLVARELSFRHLYVPQTKRWLIQKHLRRGRKKGQGGVSQHSKRAVLKWMDYYEAAMICSYRADTFLVNLSQRPGNESRTGTGNYYQYSKICGSSISSSWSTCSYLMCPVLTILLHSFLIIASALCLACPWWLLKHDWWKSPVRVPLQPAGAGLAASTLLYLHTSCLPFNLLSWSSSCKMSRWVLNLITDGKFHYLFATRGCPPSLVRISTYSPPGNLPCCNLVILPCTSKNCLPPSSLFSPNG